MMSRTYHLLVLPIFAGFLISTAMTLGVALGVAFTMRLAGMATTTATSTYTISNTIRIIISFIILFITHFGCPLLKVCIETIFITTSHGSTIIGSSIVFK